MTQDSNAHIAEYLKFYLASDRAPGFAVLLSGRWGIGKTFLTKKILADTFEEGGGHDVYVSLYGLKSANEIDAALVTAVFPALATPEGKVATAVGRALLKYAKIDLQLKTEDLAKKNDARVYVFDDLERCEMPLNSVMGYINSFVEHYGSRVIIVANEKKIRRSKSYRRWREKLIGRSFVVKSEFGAALAAFLTESRQDDFTAFCQKNVAAIATVFDQSGSENLRTLRQTIFEFGRLFSVIPADIRANDAAMTATLKLVFALSFELKLGRLKLRHLLKRTDRKYAGLIGDKKKASAFSVASSRYPDIDLDDGLLTDEVLLDFFGRGIVSADAVAAAIKNSAYVNTGSEEPTWRVVWHLLEREVEQGEAAIADLERQFRERHFIAIGEILHVFGLRLWLVQEKFVTQTTEEVVEECKSYVDDLWAQGKLIPYPIWDRGEDFHYQGYGGLGINCHESDEYRELFEYLKNARKGAQSDQFPKLARELLQELAVDPKLYVRRICTTNSSDSIYSHTPLLASLPAAEFVDFVLSLSAEHQRWAFWAFKERYSVHALRNELAPEKPWLQRVRADLESRIDQSPRLLRYRIRTYLDWYFAPILSEEHAGAPASD